MSKDKALRLALSTLHEVREDTFRLLRNGEKRYSEMKVWDTIYEIKKALETKDEPVAWMTINVYGYEDDIWYENPEGKLLEGWTYEPLYTTPQRTWIGLTGEEREQVEVESYGKVPHHVALIAAVEAKLKEKNT
jgi:hypothetical protein